MPKTEKNDGKKLSCCPELNHNSDSHLHDTFDEKFLKEFGCVLPFFTNFKNQSFMCDLGVPNNKISEYYTAYNGKQTYISTSVAPEPRFGSCNFFKKPILKKMAKTSLFWGISLKRTLEYWLRGIRLSFILFPQTSPIRGARNCDYVSRHWTNQWGTPVAGTRIGEVWGNKI